MRPRCRPGARFHGNKRMPEEGACADREQVVEPAKGDVKAHGVRRRARNVKALRPPAARADERRAPRRRQLPPAWTEATATPARPRPGGAELTCEAPRGRRGGRARASEDPSRGAAGDRTRVPAPRPRLSSLGTNRFESARCRAANSPIAEGAGHRPIRSRQVRGPEGRDQSAAVAAYWGRSRPMRRSE